MHRLIIWKRLKNAASMFVSYNLGLVILDAFRPPKAQYVLREAYKSSHNGIVDDNLVANPDKWSTHSLTCHSIDVMPTHFDGTLAAFPCKFDEFERSSIDNNFAVILEELFEAQMSIF